MVPMNCRKYRELYAKHGKLPLARDVWDTPEHEAQAEHFHDCASCYDWTLVRRVEERGEKVANYPCVHIAYHVTEKLVSDLPDPFDDADVVIWKSKSTGEYGIPIRDGGSAIHVINNCPWCGVGLYGNKGK
jgi:hypothetical protein